MAGNYSTRVLKSIDAKAARYNDSPDYAIATKLGVAQSILTLAIERVALIHGAKAAEDLLASLNIA